MLLSELILFESLIVWVGSYQPSVPRLYRHLTEAKRGIAIIDLTAEPFKLLPQTVHEKRITYLEKTLPRTPSKNWMLPVEYDLRFPESFFHLDAQVQSERLEEHRKNLKTLHIKFIISPPGPRTLLQIQLAERLGAIVKEVNGLYVCELP